MRTDFYKMYKPIIPNIEHAFSCVLKEGIFIGGHFIDELEKQLSIYLQANEVVCCKSGTHSLMLALLSAGVEPGDEVVTIGTTYYATSKAITNIGAKCVFCDCVDAEGYMDESACISTITKNTKAVIPVHLYGFPHKYLKLKSYCKENSIAIIEDCSHSFGSRLNNEFVGSNSDYACFSMYPTKNLGAFGDAGFIATTNNKASEKMRRLRYYADSDRVKFESKALHARMDTLQAALLSEVLKFFPVLRERRRQVYNFYRETIPECFQQLHEEEGSEVVPYEYPVLFRNRDNLFDYLRQHEIPVQKHYATMLHQLPEFKNEIILPNTTSFNNSILCLPVIPDEHCLEHAQIVIELIQKYFKNM